MIHTRTKHGKVKVKQISEDLDAQGTRDGTRLRPPTVENVPRYRTPSTGAFLTIVWGRVLECRTGGLQDRADRHTTPHCTPRPVGLVLTTISFNRPFI